MPTNWELLKYIFPAPGDPAKAAKFILPLKIELLINVGQDCTAPVSIFYEGNSSSGELYIDPFLSVSSIDTVDSNLLVNNNNSIEQLICVDGDETVENYSSNDNGGAGELFGSPLTDNPAWFR